MQRFATSADSHFVVAAVDKRVLAWDIDDVLPRRGLDERPASVALAGADHVVVATGRDTRWLERRGPQRPFTSQVVDATPAFVELATSPSGDRAVVGDLAHRGRVVAPGRATVELGTACGSTTRASSTARDCSPAAATAPSTSTTPIAAATPSSRIAAPA